MLPRATERRAMGSHVRARVLVPVLVLAQGLRLQQRLVDHPTAAAVALLPPPKEGVAGHRADCLLRRTQHR